MYLKETLTYLYKIWLKSMRLNQQLSNFKTYIFNLRMYSIWPEIPQRVCRENLIIHHKLIYVFEKQNLYYNNLYVYLDIIKRSVIQWNSCGQES